MADEPIVEGEVKEEVAEREEPKKEEEAAE